MKKIWKEIGLMMVALLMVAPPAVAKVTFGVRAGGAYSAMVHKIDDTYDAGARFGFSAAGLVDIPLYKGISLRPEVAFVNQGGWYTTQVGGLKSVLTQPGHPAMSERKYSYYSVQIPVNLAYTFTFTDVRLSVFAGPALDLPIFGKMKEEGISHHLKFGSNSTDDLKAFNIGINLGLGVEYSNFVFSISALCGTADRRAVKIEGESPVYQNNVTFSLGYFFR